MIVYAAISVWMEEGCCGDEQERSELIGVGVTESAAMEILDVEGMVTKDLHCQEQTTVINQDYRVTLPIWTWERGLRTPPGVDFSDAVRSTDLVLYFNARRQWRDSPADYWSCKGIVRKMEVRL